MNSKISKGLILLALMESLEDFKEHVTSSQLDRLDKELDNIEELLVGWLDTDKTPEEYIEAVLHCISLVKDFEFTQESK